jgi:hypothetical protein
MTAPACGPRAAWRLAELGVAGPALQAFLAWRQRAGYLDSLDRYSDRDLAGRVAEFVSALSDRAGVTLARPSRPAAPPAPAPAPASDRREPAAVLCWFEPPVPTPAIVRREARR